MRLRRLVWQFALFVVALLAVSSRAAGAMQAPAAGVVWVGAVADAGAFTWDVVMDGEDG